MIIVTSLVLLIPIAFMYGIIGGRQDYKNEAKQNVVSSWAAAQTVQTPTMVYMMKDKNSKNVEKALTLNNYDVDVKINTEVRKKGIFKIPVYTADVNLKGDFTSDVDLAGKKITTEVGVTDERGFETEPVFKINNQSPQTSHDVSFKTDIKNNTKSIPFEISYRIKGMEDFGVALGGVNNKISMSGNWKDPSFEGNFLPATRKVTNQGFDAQWSVPKIALTSDNPDLQVAAVSLLVPVDSYKMTERALKYGFLFLALTFLSYFIYEVVSKAKIKIHPVQYCLLGGAILIFYLLLVSISELLPFLTAYLISAFMIISMIFGYTHFVITKKQNLSFSALITVLMAILYGYLYALLQLQDFALLMGSLGLFVIVAVIMYLTRNVEWYNA